MPAVTLKAIHEAPMWTVFRGKPRAKIIPKRLWDLFGGIEATTDPRSFDRVRSLGYEFIGGAPQEPMRDDERVIAAGLDEKITDAHAWLAYLAKGGTLMKVPDSPDPRQKDHQYYRLVAVKLSGRRRR